MDMHAAWRHKHRQSPLVMLTFLAKNFGVMVRMHAPITRICISIDAGISVIALPIT
jgi:hypothetical protein